MKYAIFSGMLLVLGCVTSKPVSHFYTLDMGPSGDVVCSKAIVIENVLVTEALLRRQIMVRTSPIQIEYYATAEWASSISDLVAQKLAAEFSNTLNNPQKVLLSIQVFAFEQRDLPNDKSAYTKLHVRVHSQGERNLQKLVFEKTYDARVPLSSPVPQEVAIALSKAIEAIAIEIAKDVDSMLSN